MNAIQIDRLIRSKRRTIALIVETDGSLTVRAPNRAVMRDINAFIDEKSKWIVRTQKKIKSIVVIPEKKFEDGEMFMYMGSEYPFTLVKPQRPALKFNNGFTLGVTAQKRGRQAFTKWYKEQAFNVISERVRIISALHGFNPKQVKITSAKTRWGSCSADGTLNFTWRLVMAPLEVIDYVVVHELAHLKVKNHSPRFWKVVESNYPDYKSCRKWLQDHGEILNL